MNSFFPRLFATWCPNGAIFGAIVVWIFWRLRDRWEV